MSYDNIFQPGPYRYQPLVYDKDRLAAKIDTKIESDLQEKGNKPWHFGGWAARREDLANGKAEHGWRNMYTKILLKQNNEVNKENWRNVMTYCNVSNHVKRRYR
jgi:hypothetical protein